MQGIPIVPLSEPLSEPVSDDDAVDFDDVPPVGGGALVDTVAVDLFAVVVAASMRTLLTVVVDVSASNRRLEVDGTLSPP
jgi:hypothetical protein